MKKILIAIGLAAMVSSSQAQGLINFLNGTTTLITLTSNSVVLGSTPAGAPASYRFELFIGPAGTLTDAGFTPTGLIATNINTAGRIIGGNNLAIPGAPLGGTRAILIRGWSANLGANWAAALANQGVIGGYFGSSSIASNFLLGGDGGSGNVPTSPAFGGASGIQSGFTLTYVPVVPEPSSMALAGLGAAALMIFRRRKN